MLSSREFPWHLTIPCGILLKIYSNKLRPPLDLGCCKNTKKCSNDPQKLTLLAFQGAFEGLEVLYWGLEAF
jgi:hypothetical protein